MPFKIDVANDTPILWTLTEAGVERHADPGYRPRFYVGVGDPAADADRSGKLGRLRERLHEHPAVIGLRRDRQRRGWRHGYEAVLRVAVDRLDDVRDVARTVRGWETPTTYRCYNVDFSRQFRYVLETGVDPTPTREPRVVDLTGDPHACAEPPVRSLTVDGETVDSV